VPEPDEPVDAESARAVDEELVPGLSGIVDAALGLGAAIARTVARATTSRPLPPPGERPLADIVRYGTTAAGSVLSLVVDQARSSSRTVMDAVPTPGRQRNAAERPAQDPWVTAGSTLRVPLLVENTGPAATPEIAFAAVEVERVDSDTADDAARLPISAAVTFTPPVLVIPPRDFEKLAA
jgi:hypothetical protein